MSVSAIPISLLGYKVQSLISYLWLVFSLLNSLFILVLFFCQFLRQGWTEEQIVLWREQGRLTKERNKKNQAGIIEFPAGVSWAQLFDVSNWWLDPLPLEGNREYGMYSIQGVFKGRWVNHLGHALFSSLIHALFISTSAWPFLVHHHSNGEAWCGVRHKAVKGL